MSNRNENTWNMLLQAGLVQNSAPEPEQLESPWYIKLLLAISGWLASLFLLGFLGAGFVAIFRSEAASLIVGALFIGAAYSLLRMPKNEFYEHAALAVSLAGQALIAWVIFDIGNSSWWLVWILIAVFQLGLAIVMPNYIHRVFSSFIAAFSLSMGLAALSLPYIASSSIMFAAAWLWLHEFDFPIHMQKQRAIGYGLILALIQIKGTALFNPHGIGWYLKKENLDIWITPWMGELLAGAITLYVVWHILKRLGHSLTEPVTIAALVGTAFIAAASMEAQGITVGILILLLGFAGSNRILMGLGTISLLFYISAYYYLLDTTLLDKAQTLLLVGLVLLGTRWLLLRIIQTNRGEQHG